MNKQRKVLITITYNEMGIIIDTKAEEVAHARDIDVPIKRGHWIAKGYPWDACSLCGTYVNGYDYWKYCPNCGAYMEGKE